MNTVFDFAPLWRSGVGFDRLFDMLDQAGKWEPADNYPPYNIEKTGEDAYRVTLAVAGFMPEELSITSQPNLLVVSGKQAESQGGSYLHQGIAGRAFERRFNRSRCNHERIDWLPLGMRWQWKRQGRKSPIDVS